MAGIIRSGLVISALEPMRNSKYGNPRYRVVFTDGTSAPTVTDGSVAYGIANSEFSGVALKVEFNSAGNIAHVYTMDGRFQA